MIVLKSHLLSGNLGHIVLRYDAECALCSFAITHLVKRDRRNLFKLDNLPITTIACERILEIETSNKQKLYGFSAVLASLDYLGYYRIVSVLNFFPIRIVLEIIYNWIAKHRYRLQFLKFLL